MVLEILFWFVAGLGVGFTIGLIPGIHPNTIVVLVPLFSSLQIEPVNLLVFLVSLGIANVFADFIPSMLLGAPDGDSGFAALPGHRLLMAGKGYCAVRLAVVGGLGAIILVLLALPGLMLVVPWLYDASRPYIHLILIGFVTFMIASEQSAWKVFWAVVMFFLSGLVGIFAFQLPVDRWVVLFPILAGFFGIPQLLLQIRRGFTKLPEQNTSHKVLYDDDKTQNAVSVGLGTAGGILAGFLPGIGSSEIAGFFTIKRNDDSFLTTFGSLAVSNAIMSFLALWLIGNPRSGVAAIADQLVSVDFGLMIAMVFAAVAAAGVSVPVTLFLCRRLLSILASLDYTIVSKVVLMFLVFAIAWTAGLFGILLAVICTAIGLFVNLGGIRRGVLMGVLILPTILFFAGL